jgi:hypothetical protein
MKKRVCCLIASLCFVSNGYAYFEVVDTPEPVKPKTIKVVTPTSPVGMGIVSQVGVGEDFKVSSFGKDTPIEAAMSMILPDVWKVVVDKKITNLENGFSWKKNESFFQIIKREGEKNNIKFLINWDKRYIYVFDRSDNKKAQDIALKTEKKKSVLSQTSSSKNVSRLVKPKPSKPSQVIEKKASDKVAIFDIEKKIPQQNERIKEKEIKKKDNELFFVDINEEVSPKRIRQGEFVFGELKETGSLTSYGKNINAPIAYKMIFSPVWTVKIDNSLKSDFNEYKVSWNREDNLLNVLQKTHNYFSQKKKNVFWIVDEKNKVLTLGHYKEKIYPVELSAGYFRDQFRSFCKKWGYTVIFEGDFEDKINIRKAIEVKGEVFSEDVNSISQALNENGKIDFYFNIYKNNTIVVKMINL